MLALMFRRARVYMPAALMVLAAQVVDEPRVLGDAPTGYVLTFNDDFSGSVMDPAKWEFRYTGARRGGYNDPSVISVGGGNLSITSYYDTVNHRYDAGIIDTQKTFQQTFGYFEARIKSQSNAGAFWSAFWMNSPDIANAASPPDPADNGAEIDIMEYRAAKNALQSALHWNGYNAPAAQSAQMATTPVGFAPGQWHTYGVLWTASSYTFYVDNTAVWTTTQGVSQRPEYMLLSTEIADASTLSWCGGTLAPSYFPDGIQVDYVRAYQAPAAVPLPSSIAIGAAGLVVLASRGLRQRKSTPGEF